ncbi:hypothetical protein SDRG_08506 [Saprolegnia diclina VS20]|uniref:FYVE-type domain-containing protein n=1 Tax=Saprolegnia diclina (strain VS20) TaxID=1156394 RepID=T0RN91_SAPDV|nr:hypothetical protein SDRG_08506 [Saprolegnia diclina VS20]EQC33823.1 hypothetical protein SDRG_08506 [Saprolegnia diclina VS20]|eukprot:XP_008612618.1 hypothetical protein SDRG_08506 [Saprolegnia diclina VS20]
MSSFTLPRGVFQTPELSPETKATLRERGHDLLRTFVASVTKKQHNALVWDPVGDAHGVSLFQATDPSTSDKNVMQYRALAKINATLDEVARLHCFDTKAQCDQYRRHLAHDVLGLLPLYVLSEPTSSDATTSRMYIKWSVIQSPVALIKDRDFTYLETQDAFVLESGRRGWAYCQSSISLPGCPALPQYDVVRGHLANSGCVFLETERPGTLDVIYHLGTDVHGNVPHFVRQMAIKRRGKSIARLDKYIHEMRLGQLPIHAKSAMHHGPPPKSCATCFVSFRFRASKICQSCGQVVCAKCSRKWSLHVLQHSKVDVRICHVCSLAVRDGSMWEKSDGGAPRLRGVESASMPDVYRPSTRYDDDNLTASMPRPSMRRPSDILRRPSSSSQISDSSRVSTLSQSCDLSYVEMYGPPMSPSRRSSIARSQRRRSSVAMRAAPTSAPTKHIIFNDPTTPDLSGDFDIIAPAVITPLRHS